MSAPEMSKDRLSPILPTTPSQQHEGTSSKTVIPSPLLPRTEAPHQAEARKALVKSAVLAVKKKPRHTDDLLQSLCKNQTAHLRDSPLYPFFLQKYKAGKDSFLAAIQRMLKQNPHDRTIQKVGMRLATLCIEAAKITALLKQEKTAALDVQKALLSTSDPYVVADMLSSQKPSALLATALKLFQDFKPHLSSEQLKLYYQTKLDVDEAMKIGKAHTAELKLRQLKNSSLEAFQTLLKEIRTEFKAKSVMAELDGLLNQTDVESVHNALAQQAPIELIISSLAAQSTIRERFTQLTYGTSAQEFETHTSSSKSKLSGRDALKIALFIETTKKTETIAKMYFTAQEHDISRDIHIDWQAREVYIISEDSSSQLQARGTYKKAQSAIAIPLDTRRKAEVEQVVQLTPISSTPSKTSQETLDAIASEQPFYIALKDVLGVAKLRSITNITFVLEDAAQPRKSLSLIFNRANKGTLEQVVLNGGPLSFARQSSIGRQIVHTFAQMHKKNVFHGDGKLSNILIDTEDHIFITDFGLAHFMTKPLNANHFLKEYNVYGAWWSTPFELLRMSPTELSFGNNPQVTKEQHKKVESFAVGCMLFEMAFGRPPWAQELIKQGWPPQKQDSRTKKNKLSKDALEKMEQEYREKVLQPLQTIAAIAEVSRTPEQHYQFALFKLMDQVEHRWTAEQVDDYLKKWS